MTITQQNTDMSDFSEIFRSAMDKIGAHGLKTVVAALYAGAMCQENDVRTYDTRSFKAFARKLALYPEAGVLSRYLEPVWDQVKRVCVCPSGLYTEELNLHVNSFGRIAGALGLSHASETLFMGCCPAGIHSCGQEDIIYGNSDEMFVYMYAAAAGADYREFSGDREYDVIFADEKYRDCAADFLSPEGVAVIRVKDNCLQFDTSRRTEIAVRYNGSYYLVCRKEPSEGIRFVEADDLPEAGFEQLLAERIAAASVVPDICIWSIDKEYEETDDDPYWLEHYPGYTKVTRPYYLRVKDVIRIASCGYAGLSENVTDEYTGIYGFCDDFKRYQLKKMPENAARVRNGDLLAGSERGKALAVDFLEYGERAAAFGMYRIRIRSEYEMDPWYAAYLYNKYPMFPVRLLPMEEQKKIGAEYREEVMKTSEYRCMKRADR